MRATKRPYRWPGSRGPGGSSRRVSVSAGPATSRLHGHMRNWKIQVCPDNWMWKRQSWLMGQQSMRCHNAPLCGCPGTDIAGGAILVKRDRYLPPPLLPCTQTYSCSYSAGSQTWGKFWLCILRCEWHCVVSRGRQGVIGGATGVQYCIVGVLQYYNNK